VFEKTTSLELLISESTFRLSRVLRNHFRALRMLISNNVIVMGFIEVLLVVEELVDGSEAGREETTDDATQDSYAQGTAKGRKLHPALL